MRSYLVSLVVTLPCAHASAQSLFHVALPAEATLRAPVDARAEPLYSVSLIAVQPPRPKAFLPNDLVTIVIREQTSVTREQTLESEKELDLDIAMANVTTLRQFLELRPLQLGTRPTQSKLLEADSEFSGEGEYERRDDFSARVTARVVEVKPNGTLLLEARTTVQTDEEIQVILLSGLCRTEDIAGDNTVFSSQIYDLNLVAKHSGEIKRAASKGLIPRAIEFLINF